MVSFDGVVIVTGASGGGCGRGIAARFAQGGASVVVSDINDPGGEETVRLIQRDRGRAAFFHGDVRDERQVRDLIRVWRPAGRRHDGAGQQRLRAVPAG